MQQLWFINNPLAQHVLGIIMPIFRSTWPYITAYGFLHLTCWLVSWGAGQYIKCWKLYAVVYGQVLLKMGMMMPETCWANGLLINKSYLLHLVGLTRHFILRMHGHTNIKWTLSYLSCASISAISLFVKFKVCSSSGSLFVGIRWKCETVLNMDIYNLSNWPT